MAKLTYCPHSGERIADCECAYTDPTSPYFDLRVAHDTGNTELKRTALARIKALEAKNAR